MTLHYSWDRKAVWRLVQKDGIDTIIEVDRPPLYIPAGIDKPGVPVLFFKVSMSSLYVFTDGDVQLYRQEGDNEPQLIDKPYNVGFDTYEVLFKPVTDASFYIIGDAANDIGFSPSNKGVDWTFSDDLLDDEFAAMLQDNEASTLRLKLVSRYSFLRKYPKGSLRGVGSELVPIWTTEAADKCLTKEMILDYGKLLIRETWHQIAGYLMDEVFLTKDREESRTIMFLLTEIVSGGHDFATFSDRIEKDTTLSTEAKDFIIRQANADGPPEYLGNSEIPEGYKIVKE